MLERLKVKIAQAQRLHSSEGLYLLTEADLMEVGRWAQFVRQRMHPGRQVTYVVDANPNYTNVCVAGCAFCAFYRRRGHPEAYTLSLEEVMDRIRPSVDAGATTVLLQGGLNPELPFEYYVDLVRETRRRFPQVTPHYFTASEVLMMAEVSGKSISQVLSALQEAGQVSLPGGGAEVLSENVRRKISPKKNSVDEWIQVHREAHKLGMKSTATLMYGHLDRPEDWLEHFNRVRDLQDETGGFTAFIPWSFKPRNTALERRIPRQTAGGARPMFGGPSAAGPSTYLRILSAARVYLDNIPHIQASWFGEGKKTGQVALHFGADDFGGTVFDESVHQAAGHNLRTTVDEIAQLIREAGFIPAQRTTLYEEVLQLSRN
jgi:cyclic dehypoxanthinyl futalosine synthase